MVTPLEPVTELVIQDIVTTLQTVPDGPTANYWHTFATVVRHEDFDDDLLEYPAAMVLGLDTNEDDTTYHNQQNLHLNFRVVGVLEVWDDLQKASRRLAGDIHRALLVDHTRGGIALDTHITRVVPFLYQSDTDPESARGGVTVLGSVHLRHLRGDPFTP